MKIEVILLFVCILVIVLNLSCSGSVEPELPLFEVIYYNSFEKESDLFHWKGINSQNLVEDACPQGGRRSVFISGGCVIPHASFTLRPPGSGLLVYVECYGKNLSNGGHVDILIGNDYLKSYCLNIIDTIWTKYICEEDILWPADSSMTIWMSAGGYIPSAMLIDELKIVKAN